MRIVLPIKRPAATDRLIPRREVMDVLNIQSSCRVKRMVERGELPKPVELAGEKPFRLSELAAMYPGIFVIEQP